VGGAEFLKSELLGAALPIDTSITIQLSLLIGAVTLTGSLVAYAKLQELISGRPIVFFGLTALNAVLLAAILALGAWQVVHPESLLWPFYAVCVLSLLLGVLVVMPIGGADMPVVISLLNSYSGIAAAMTGFVIHNDVLIISGALVGSSGIILSQIMCKAMNRSLANVLFGAFGSAGGTVTARSAEGMSVRQVSAEDAAIQLAYAKLVIIVPGYGLAVAQAQHLVRELADLIENRGGEVKYAIHPVAGRMPGHMNVLLAEANVPYDKLYDMEQINSEFERADVALVIGANDVVNPAARNDPGSPIFGMPILNADHARSVIVLKRGMGSGFAGIENELFYNPRTAMLFGDAKASLTTLVSEIKHVS
jgi:NAD(P) transhydrogenase subunit beta